MKLKEKDIKRLALLFSHLANNRYRLVVIEEGNDEGYLFDLLNEAEDGLDQLIQKTLLACLNNLDKTEKIPLLTYERVDEKKDKFSPYRNPFLWDQTTKKPQ